MPNQLYQTLDEAIANAPLEPFGAYCEVKPGGPPETKRAVLRALVRRAIDAGLRIEILADEPTLAEPGPGGKYHDGQRNGKLCRCVFELSKGALHRSRTQAYPDPGGTPTSGVYRKMNRRRTGYALEL